MTQIVNAELRERIYTEISSEMSRIFTKYAAQDAPAVADSVMACLSYFIAVTASEPAKALITYANSLAGTDWSAARKHQQRAVPMAVVKSDHEDHHGQGT